MAAFRRVAGGIAIAAALASVPLLGGAATASADRGVDWGAPGPGLGGWGGPASGLGLQPGLGWGAPGIGILPGPGLGGWGGPASGLGLLPGAGFGLPGPGVF
jgi:hypothetical protein